jgi:signal transduction histidine kinase
MTTSNPPVPAARDSVDLDNRARLAGRLRTILVTLCTACVVVLPIGYWTANRQAFWTSLTGLVVGGGSFLLHHLRRVDAAVQLLLVGMLLAVSVSMMAGHGIHDSGMILYPTIIVLGSLLLRPVAYRVLVSLVVVSVVSIWWLGLTGRIAPEFRELTDVADLAAIVVVLALQAVAVNVLARGLFGSLREARRENVERRAAEEEVRRLNLDLERRVAARTAELAAANEDLESFSYSVSHDLRAPLRVAGNYASILHDEYSKDWDPAARHLLDRIRLSNTRMNVLIDELLRFSRLGRKSIVKTPVDMDAVVRHAIDTLVTAAPERDVEWVLGRLPVAMAEPVLIEQVFTNLLGNALKYTSKRERARIEVGFDEAGGEPSYFVKDDGAGFDMRHVDRLFGVFERLHHAEEFEGNGIGLATAQRILHKHGGRIWALAEPDKGATFRFQLPPA